MPLVVGQIFSGWLDALEERLATKGGKVAIVGSANNPAGRLHQLVYAADAVSGSPTGLELWQAVFDQQDLPAVMTRLAAALTLPGTINTQLQVALTTSDASSFLTGVDEIERVLRYQASNLAQRTPRPFRGCAAGKASLERGDQILAASSPAGFSFANLDGLAESVSGLRSDLVSSGLEEPVLGFLLALCDSIAEAISLSRIEGPATLQASVDKTLGALARHPWLAEDSVKLGWGTRLRRLVVDVATVAGATAAVFGVIEPAPDRPPIVIVMEGAEHSIPALSSSLRSIEGPAGQARQSPGTTGQGPAEEGSAG